MQSGMLFESLLTGGGAGCDVEQLHVVLDEALDPRAMASAFTLVCRRHEALTAAFEWEGCARPQQRFHPDVVVPVELEDWRGLSADERAARRAAFLERDRARGFDLRRPPLMRATLLPFDDGTEVVWTFHHIVIDGRSIPSVLAEVLVAYDDFRLGRAPLSTTPRRSYREYLAWLPTLDAQKNHDFFRAMLAGKTAATPLPLAEPAGRPLAQSGYGDRTRTLDDATLAAARDLAKRTETSLATVIYAAWALVLGRTTGDQDVLFGATRACRRSVPGGADDIVGLFINSPPVRAAVTDDRTVGELLASLRGQMLLLREHEHTPIVDITAASALPRGRGAS
jgi:hypothetical protein